MPFPVNWLEELVIEWLELDGFAVSTNVSIPAGHGGRFSPDAVGVRVDNDTKRLRIRHCEAAMYLIQGPCEVAKKYAAKFSPEVQQAVWDHFSRNFSAYQPQEALYEKWLITFRPSACVRTELEKAIPGIQIQELTNFVRYDVLSAIERWRERPKTKMSALPTDKWLLQMIDMFKHFGLISKAG